MFNISFSELLFIFILAFIVLGPEKLPRTFYSLGIIVRKIKHEYTKIQKEINLNINQQMSEDFKKSLKSDLAIDLNLNTVNPTEQQALPENSSKEISVDQNNEHVNSPLVNKNTQDKT